MKTYNIVMMGPQGSGKGTQARQLAERLGIPHISTGDAFREIKKENSDLGRKVKSLIDNGRLVDDGTTNDVVASRFKKPDVRNGYILDGYPRTMPQLLFLESLKPVNYCILIDVSDEESMKRILARRVCSECKENYNTIYIKPKKSGICDACGGVLVTRDDDKPDLVRERLKKYHLETGPMLEFYKKKGVFYRVKGEQEIAKVFGDIAKMLKV